MLKKNEEVELYTEEKTLEDYVKDKKQLRAEEIYTIAVNLCEAIQKSTTLNIYNGYRELKPSNIIITSNKKVTLFHYDINNIHKVYDSKGTISMTSNTNTSYERRNTANFIRQNYILSIGMVMYYMTTGKFPLTVLQPLMDESYDENVDENLKRIIRKCLQSDGSMEYGSIEELKREIIIGLMRESKYKDTLEKRTVHSNKVCRTNKKVKKANEFSIKKTFNMLPKAAVVVLAFFYSLLIERKILKF